MVVGVAWQTSLVALPVYVVIRRYDFAGIAFAVVVVTSIILKLTWYDHLKKMYVEVPVPQAPPGVAARHA